MSSLNYELPRIVNIRGTSGSGKSTLVKRLLESYPFEPVYKQLSDWKIRRCIGYIVKGGQFPLFVVGRYDTQCGGCDSMSFKGAHDDMEAMVREAATKGCSVLFEGLTVSSTLTRWQRISDDFPGQFVWAFMMTPEEECHQRILSRNGGKEPKHKGAHNLADYQMKYRNCMRHYNNIDDAGTEHLMPLLSDDQSYEMLRHTLGFWDAPSQP